MTNLITGLVAVTIVIVFLGNYAVKLGSIPLWIIIGSILAMAVTDFVQSVRERNDNSGS